jgi:hypothetical protein
MLPATHIKRGFTGHALGSTPLGKPPYQLHAPTSFWNRKLPHNAPILTANNYASKMGNQMKYYDGSTPVRGFFAKYYSMIIQTSEFTPPLWVVNNSTPKRKVFWMINNGAGPPASDTTGNGLQLKFNEVPMPAGLTAAQIRSAGSDQEVGFLNVDTGEWWEFWKLTDTPPSAYADLAGQGWFAAYGGYSTGAATTTSGTIASWNGAFANNWGTRATSLSVLGGVMRMREYHDGGFPHALNVGVPIGQVGNITPTFIAPATRTDSSSGDFVSGSDGRDAVPAGAWFRLPYDYVPPSNITPLCKMMLEAIRDYGFFVVDRTGGTVNFYAEQNKGTDPQLELSNPWVSANIFQTRVDLFDKVNWQLLQQVDYAGTMAMVS